MAHTLQEVTIYDIADLAGVSASTVSRVINNYPYVKKATRARVLKLLEEYHYVPNETARGLVNQSSKMIGILISDIRTTQHTDGVYYIERELSRQGYSCLIYNTGVAEKDQARYIQLLSQRKVDAAVLMGSIYQTEEVCRSIQTYLPTTPVVICNGFLEAPNIYGLIADERNGVCDCVELLANKGRKGVAFVVNQYTPSNHLKEQGYLDGMRRFLPEAEPLVIQSGSSVQEIFQATTEMVKLHPEVTGIIFSEDLLAAVGIRALAELHLSVPGDVAIIGINNSQFAEICVPTLTSLDNMLYDLSLMAARNLTALLQGEHINKKMMICSKIVERQST